MIVEKIHWLFVYFIIVFKFSTWNIPFYCLHLEWLSTNNLALVCHRLKAQRSLFVSYLLYYGHGLLLFKSPNRNRVSSEGIPQNPRGFKMSNFWTLNILSVLLWCKPVHRSKHSLIFSRQQEEKKNRNWNASKYCLFKFESLLLLCACGPISIFWGSRAALLPGVAGKSHAKKAKDFKQRAWEHYVLVSGKGALDWTRSSQMQCLQGESVIT